MIVRTLRIAAALAAGALTGGGLYWAFLNTPDSNALMLAVSAALLLATLGVVAVAVNTAVLLALDAPLGSALRAASRGTGWFLVALLPLAAGWWLLGGIDERIAARAGELNAWFIATFNWADISPLLSAELWMSRWLRFAMLPLASLSLLAVLLTNKPGRGGAWLRAWRWRPLAIGVLVFVVLFALPWQLTAWRPDLPATWAQPAVAALRLGAVLALALAGTAVLVQTAVKNK